MYTSEPAQDGERSVTLERVGELAAVGAAYHVPPAAHADDWRLFFVHRDRVAAVTAEDVRRVAGRYLVATNATIGTYVPTAEPSRVEVASVPAEELERIVAGYRPAAELADAGEEFDASPRNIHQRTEVVEVGERWILAALPKKTRGQRVVGELRLHVGTREELVPDKLRINPVLARMLERGTTSRSREEIKRELDRLQATVRVFGSGTTTTVSIETVRGSLPEVLDLVAEMVGSKVRLEIKDPRYPALRLASYILGESQLDSRIAARLRQEEGISYGAWGSLTTSEIGDDGGFSAGAILAPQNMALAKRALREEIERALADGFAEEEFVKRRKSYVDERRVGLANDQIVASYMNDFLLRGETFLWYGDFLEKISTVERAQAEAALREVLSPDDLSWVAAYDFSLASEQAEGAAGAGEAEESGGTEP